MPLTGHTSTVIGTQTRGSATGTLRRWEPPNDVVLAAGIESEVLNVFAPDALALGFDWEIKAASADGIERVRILASQDGTNFDEIWAKDLDPDVAPNNPNNVFNFAALTGWNFQYVQVLMTSKTGGGGSVVNASVTESIFTSGYLQVYEPTLQPGSVENFNERQSHVYAEGQVFGAALDVSEQASSEVVLNGVKKFDLELGIKITNRTTLALLTIRPEVYIGGEWRSLHTATIAPNVQTVNPGFVIEVPVSADFNCNGAVSEGPITASRYRFFVKGDVADAELELYAIAKVPY